MQNSITDAVRRLRQELGDTQQSFAQRTGLAISTVVRYELSRPPRGDALKTFKELAEQHGFTDLARIFAYAMGTDIGPETGALHAAITSLWWNRKSLNGWPKLASMLVAQFEELLRLKRNKPETVDESIEELETRLHGLRMAVEAKALDLIQSKADDIMTASPELSREQALRQAWETNPELYKQYLQERADAARGTQFESSLAVYGTRQHAEAQKKKRAAQAKRGTRK